MKAATKRVLKACRHQSPTEAAVALGVGVNDIRNMRQGNQISVPILLKLVRYGWDPASIMVGPELKPSSRSTRAVRQRLVNGRIRKLARLRPGKEIAKLTGLSVTGAYGLRYDPDANVSLTTIMGFWFGGHDLRTMIYGGAR